MTSSSEQLKVVVRPIRQYEVLAEDGRIIGRFDVMDEMEGMLLMQGRENRRDQRLVVDCPRDVLDSIFNAEKDKTVPVIKGSPSLLVELQPRESSETLVSQCLACGGIIRTRTDS